MAKQGSLPRSLLKRIRLVRLGRAEGFTAWLVDGAVIRNKIDIEFTLGGNPERYSYIPRNEIWLEWTGDEADVEATFMHEVVETRLMREGQGYDEAHEWANVQEETIRSMGGSSGLPHFVKNPTGIKTVRGTVAWRDRYHRRKFQRKAADRRLRAVDQTEEGVVYECLNCGEHHEYVYIDPGGRVVPPSRLAGYHGDPHGSVSGYCPYCSDVKKNKGLPRFAKNPEETAAAFVPKFLQRHPEVLPIFELLRLEVVDGQQTAIQHGEAQQLGDNRVLLLPKFWALPEETQDYVFAHEVGHAVHTQYGLARLIGSAQELGVEVWDQTALPFGQNNMTEAFADSFATYLLAPEELARRHPDWLNLVEELLHQLQLG